MTRAEAQRRNLEADKRAKANPEAVANAAVRSATLPEILDARPEPYFGLRLALAAFADCIVDDEDPVGGGSEASAADARFEQIYEDPLDYAERICDYLARIPAGDGIAALTLVVEEMPRPAEVDRRPTGIMPRVASVHLNLANLVRPDPADMPVFRQLSLRKPDPSGQLWLPGLEIDGGGGTSAFILAILDAGSAAKSGAGAPLRDRFFAELLMAATTGSRADGERHYLRDLRISDPVAWAGWDQRHYRPDRTDLGLALERGLRDVNTINLPLNDRGGWLIPAFVEAIKSRALDAPIIASVRLPEGSEHGARVDRTVLRLAGKASAVAWRLYLAFSFEWSRITYKGRVPHLTRPAMKRDPAGYLLDADGEILIDRHGRPMRHGKHARAVETGAREASPMAERLHRVYDGPRDLVRLAWPLGAPGQKSHPKRSEDQVVIAARWLAGETWNDSDPRHKPGEPISLNRAVLPAPGIQIERLGTVSRGNPDGFPWRIVPPNVK